MSNHYQAILGLRAIRDYQSAPISEAHMGAILEAARWTGSSKNRQNWSFVVSTGEAHRLALAECGDFTVPIRNAPAVIVIVMEPEGYEFDSGRVAQNIMLAADALGVASCPITLHRDRDAADLLGLDEGRSCRYAIALGYPAEGAGPKDFGGRKPLDELVRWERY
jgi:nitroreductase